MTNERALVQLERMLNENTQYYDSAMVSALTAAIEALEKQNKGAVVHTNCNDCKFGDPERQWIKCRYHNIYMRPEDACSKGIGKTAGCSDD